MSHKLTTALVCTLALCGGTLFADAPAAAKAEPPLKVAKSQLSASVQNNFDPKAEGTRLVEYDKIYGGGTKIADADAPQGKAISHSAKQPADKLKELHNKSFYFGLYESNYKKMVLSGYILPQRIAQDEKYHWYYVGQSPLYKGLSLWMHRNWQLSAQLGRYADPANPAAEYKIFALLKFQGEGYVKNSKLPGDIRLAQIALVQVK